MGKKEKEIEEKKMGGREKKKKEGGKVVRASGDRDCGRPRVACGRGRWGHAVGGERGKRRVEKGGAGFAAAGHDASRLMGKDGTRIEFGCRVVRKRFWELGFRV